MTTKKPRKSLGDTLANNFVYGISSIPVTDPLEEVTISPSPIVEVATIPSLSPIVEVAATPSPSPIAEVAAIPPALPISQPPPTTAISRLTEAAPDKEPTVRLTVDLPQSMHKKLSILCANTGKKKVEVVRILLEDALSHFSN